jgi:xanthine dehydrogenase YagS FAD-binding subunit
MKSFAWRSPRSIAEAAETATTTVADAMTRPAGVPESARNAVLKAGGIDLLDLLKGSLLPTDVLVSLKEVPGLDAVGEAKGGGLRIGSMATLARLSEHPIVRRHYPALAEAAGSAASPQIRNVATLGGNLLQRPRCWYFRAAEFRCLRKGGGHCFALGGENQYHAVFANRPCAIVHPSTAATALVALGATVELADPEGSRRRVALEDFFVPVEKDPHRENDLKPQEILTAIDLPPMPAGVRMAYRKQGQKESFDWPLADVAVVLDVPANGVCRAATIVLGAAAPTPHRARAAERALVGKHIDDGVARAAGLAALTGATPLAKNAYKLPLLQALVQRAVLQAALR